MIKLSAIGSYANAATFPNIKAHADIANYTIVVPNQVEKITALPTVAAAQGKNLAVIMQNFGAYVGDRYFDPLNVAGALIPKDSNALCVGLESLAARFLDIDSQHITGDFSDIAPGTYLVAGADGKFAVSGNTAPAGYAMYFLVTDILSPLAKPLAGSAGAVRAQIIVP